ncbi:MAG: TonB family protein [Nitrospirae bacterium]|nr:TonB family protein [Nitrospirota bacterium]
MKALSHRGFVLVLVGLCVVALSCFSLISPVLSAFLPQSASPSGPPKRWVQFELNQSGPMGELQIGKPIVLTMVLRGVAVGVTPVVATSESKAFYSQTVTLEPDAASQTLKGTVTLEPIPMSLTSVPPQAVRVQVTFARSRQDKVERFLRRVVYVTMDRSEGGRETSELSPVSREESQSDGVIVDDVQPSVEPLLTGSLAEEDVVTLASPGEEKAYWQQVSHLISRSWARQVRGALRGTSGVTVKVRFKLYPNGRAQLIEVEKGSGARDIDEAGIYAVVHAQPFPSFQAELGEEPIDVHVRMRTGGKDRPLEVQSVGGLLHGKFDVSGQFSKK